MFYAVWAGEDRALGRLVQAVHLAHQLGDEGRGGVVVDVPGAAHLFDLGAVHDGHGLGDFHGLLLVMGDQDGGDPGDVAQALQQMVKLGAHPGVQGSRGFVQQQHARLHGHGLGPGQGHPLAVSRKGRRFRRRVAG